MEEWWVGEGVTLPGVHRSGNWSLPVPWARWRVQSTNVWNSFSFICLFTRIQTLWNRVLCLLCSLQDPLSAWKGVCYMVGTRVCAAAGSCLTLCSPVGCSPPGSPSLGFSRQEHWSGLPFPSPMQESEKWEWSCSVVSDSHYCHLIPEQVHHTKRKPISRYFPFLPDHQPLEIKGEGTSLSLKINKC